ncbi:MAG: P-loop NTPase [Desulfobacterales bacterium]
MKISVCGKGGSGKSTVVTLLARQAEARGQKVLVVDSDESNSGLYRMLGFDHPPAPLMELVGGRKKLTEKMRSSTDSILTGQCIESEDIGAPYRVEKNGIERKFIHGRIKALDLVEEHTVVLESA